jgi:hypothetical protein
MCSNINQGLAAISAVRSDSSSVLARSLFNKCLMIDTPCIIYLLYQVYHTFYLKVSNFYFLIVESLYH